MFVSTTPGWIVTTWTSVNSAARISITLSNAYFEPAYEDAGTSIAAGRVTAPVETPMRVEFWPRVGRKA